MLNKDGPFRTPRSTFRIPMWNVPVGVQLSVVYAVLVAATLALLGWALYANLEGFLVQNTADRLDRITRPILLRSFPQRREPGGPGLPLSASTTEQAALQLLRELGGKADVAMGVLDAQGAVLGSSGQPDSDGEVNLPALPDGWANLVASGAPAQWVEAEPAGGRRLVVLTPLTVSSRDGTPRAQIYLQQIISLEAADDVLNQLRFYIALGIVVGTAIGIVVGLALTSVILRPLERMVRTAEAIAAGDLDRRLHLPPGRNEVARLGSSFDNMVDRLGAALHAQRRFVADASHELRTPLTSLEGLSEMLLIGADRGDANVVQRTARSMHRELGRLGRLVADLLTLSRLDSTMPMKAATLDAGKLVAEVAEQLEPMAEARGVQLTLLNPVPAIVRGEPDRLKQVVLNLVDNAIRYTPEGGEVGLSAMPDPARGEVRIEVRDTGPGIDPRDLPHIFDRFYRGDASRARATGNTGLGLAIARAIVEAHAGAISVESTPGVGTLFRVALPSGQPPERQETGLPRRAARESKGEQPAPRQVV